MTRANCFLFLLFAVFSLGFETQAEAALTRVTTRGDLFFSSGGNNYKVPAGVSFRADCRSDSYCYARLRGNLIRVRNTYVSRRPIRTASYSTAGYTSGNSELGGGSVSTSSGGSRAGESRYASCFRSKGNNYTRRRCTRGGLSSINQCRGSKPASTSTGWCYMVTKFILRDCGAVPVKLSGVYAKDAGPQLQRYGYRRLSTTNPRQAPVGSVIVYGVSAGCRGRAGHIEIKADTNSYVSDFKISHPVSDSRCRYVKGIYFK